MGTFVFKSTKSDKQVQWRAAFNRQLSESNTTAAAARSKKRHDIVASAKRAVSARDKTNEKGQNESLRKKYEELFIALEFLDQCHEASTLSTDSQSEEVRQHQKADKLTKKKQQQERSGMKDKTNERETDDGISESSWDSEAAGSDSNAKERKPKKEQNREPERIREPAFGFGPPARHLKMKIPGLDVKTRPDSAPVIHEYVPRWQRGWHHEGWDCTTKTRTCFDNHPTYTLSAQNVQPKYPRNTAKQRAGVPQLHMGEMRRRDFGVENMELKVVTDFHNDEEWTNDLTPPTSFDIWLRGAGGNRQAYTQSISPIARDASLKDPVPRGAKSVCEWQRDATLRDKGQNELTKLSEKRDRSEEKNGDLST